MLNKQFVKKKKIAYTQKMKQQTMQTLNKYIISEKICNSLEKHLSRTSVCILHIIKIKINIIKYIHKQGKA